MTERKITVIEDPMAYIGIPTGMDKAILVLNPDTDHEVRVIMGPLQMLTLAQQGAFYAERLLAEHIEVIERHERNTQPDSQFIERTRPVRLDG